MKLQYFDHLMLRADSLVKILMLGKIEGRRGRGLQRIVRFYHPRLERNPRTIKTGLIEDEALAHLEREDT